MQIYEIGKPYNPEVRHWPETIQLNYRASRFELLLFYPSPSPVEQKAVQSADGEFGLLHYGDVIFFLFKFGAMPWASTPYTVHLMPKADWSPLPELQQDEGLIITVSLINAHTGIITSLRLVSLSPYFSRQLLDSLEVQMRSDFDEESYDRQIEQAYREFPSSKDMLKSAVRTKAGA